jgi:signal transduction histidine kinase
MGEVETYKRQETALILLNIAVLAALFFVHIVFLSILGRPSSSLSITLAVRFVILIFELLWVQRLTEGSERFIAFHTHLSILLNITFAFLASIFGGTADSHYWVLMVIPIVSAAYRFNLLRTMLVAATAILLTFVAVWLYFREHPPVDVSEYFEAATVSLIFLVIAVVVWLLVGDLRTEEEKLSNSLDDLRFVQEKLVAEEKLAAIGQLSSAIAHEIRNPVSMIASSLKMAEGREPGSPIRQEMLDIATVEAKRLETLTTDFLAFARSKEPELRPVTVRDSLEYLAGLSKARQAEKGLELELRCSDSLIFTMDTSQMQQAVLNLVMNAINATPSGGRVTIGAEERGDESVLYVENTGGRIPGEITSKIFEPFFTSGDSGTGLGLPIVRNIARAHGGSVYLASNENGNVRFEIRF